MSRQSGPSEPRGSICPSWCTDHETTEHTDATVQRHQASLFTLRVMAGGWVFHLYVGATDVDRGHPWRASTPPQIALVENRGQDSMPRSLSPAQAREMAAALLRGAEIVEASQTSTCERCKKPVHPAELFDDNGDPAPSGGACVRCWAEERRARRPRLSVVGENQR